MRLCRTLYYWNQKPKGYKAKEFQIYTSLYLTPRIQVELDLSDDIYSNIFKFYTNIFGLVYLLIHKNKEKDHAGFSIELNLFGLRFYYNHYDTRHWDDDTDDWCKYD